MTNPSATMSMPVGEFDPDIAAILDEERDRQEHQLEMIASENFVPRAVLECQGSVLTNKYAEGYPGRRYYGGCEAVDKAEQLAIDRAKAVFGADYANVQPHSGASANAALLAAVAKAGDTIMGLALDHGGHLTHGMKLNFSGKLYNATAYQVDKDTFRLDMDQVREAALKNRPKVLIAGWSAYPRHIDFQAFREIADEVGAVLWTDMAHFAGLVAAGLHPSPVPDSDVVTTTVHKTLGGPRSGMILSSRPEQWEKKLNSAVFPGQQGGPLMHVIAAKAVAMKVAQSDEFKDRQRRTIEGAQILAERLNGKDVAGCGITLLTGGTDVHLVMVDLRNSVLDGKKGEALLHDCGITINRNTVPWDPRPPMTGSGLRIGTAALATRGFGQEEFREVADVIAEALVGACNDSVDTEALAKRTRALADKKPLYAGLSYSGPTGTTWA